MISRPGLIQLLLGFGFLIYSSYFYLIHPTSYWIPLLTFFIILIITALFNIGEYYNRNLYLVLISVVLVVMWIVIFILSLSPDVNKIISYLETGLITLFITVIINETLKMWEKYKKALEPKPQ